MASSDSAAGPGKRSLKQGVAARRRRRVLRRLKGYLRLIATIAVAYSLYQLWTSPIWQWNGQMSIVGNRLVTRADLQQRLSVPRNTPLYRLNPQTIAAQLEGVPAVSRVAVRRWLFPARLELTVMERQALVEVLGKDEEPRNWMDQEGVVFSAPSRLMTPRFPIKMWSGLRPGQRLPATAQAHLFELLSSFPKGQSGRLDLRNPRDVYASIGDWPVRLGTVDDVELKFAMFSHLQPLAAKYKERLQYINLRFPNSPTFVLKTGDEIGVPAPTPAASARPASPGPSTGTSAAPSASPAGAASPKASPD